MDIHEELTQARIEKDLKENGKIFNQLNTICQEQIDMDLYEFLEFYSSVAQVAKATGIDINFFNKYGHIHYKKKK